MPNPKDKLLDEVYPSETFDECIALISDKSAIRDLKRADYINLIFDQFSALAAACYS